MIRDKTDLEQAWEAWEVFQKQVEAFGKTLGEILTPMFQAFAETITRWYEAIQRLFLYGKLLRWLPHRLAHWVAYHWPKRYLPHPKFDSDYENLPV